MARRRQLEATHENNDRWLLTYADMITLLVAFFIMLYGMSRIEQQKLDQFKDGVRASLGGSKLDPGKSSPSRIVADPSAGEKIYARMSGFVQREKLQHEVSVAMEPDGAIIRLTSGGMLFDNGTADLKPRTRQILEALAAAIGPEVTGGLIQKIRVEGHTDNVPIRSGRFSSNWQLSTTRATSVVEYLAERHPALRSRLEAAGCADIRALAPNTTRDGRARNRRVEIRVLQSRRS